MNALAVQKRRALGIFLIIVLFLSINTSSKAQINADVDRELFPKAYGILSSDRLMFPVDVSDWPLKIDSRRQLFVDDFLIASMDGLEREWHQPVKHPANPIMRSKLPWEAGGIIPLEIRYHAKTGKFRLWYTTRIRYKEPGGVDVRFPTLYAESNDGLEWHRPELGLLDYEGSSNNNFVVHAGRITGLFENADPTQPDRRYTALVLLEPEYVKREGYFIYTSPDGLRWTGDRNNMIIPALHGYNIPQSGIGDTSIFRYDPILGLYVCDAKFVLPGTIRCRGQCESSDLIHWTRPRFTLYTDEHDEPDSQIYGNISFVYESMWLGLCRVMHSERSGWKQVEVELSMSRDGRHWVRPAERKQFLPLGDPDSWDPDYTDPVHNGPLLIDDELWFYYRGSRHRDRDNIQTRWIYASMSMGLAKLRRDGFASLNATAVPGHIITRQLTFAGRSLFVNAEVGDNGWLKAAVLTSAGQQLNLYEINNSIPLQQSTTHGQMIWNSVQHLTPPNNDHVRLMFQLKNAKLYSFWIE